MAKQRVARRDPLEEGEESGGWESKRVDGKKFGDVVWCEIREEFFEGGRGGEWCVGLQRLLNKCGDFEDDRIYYRRRGR